MGIEDEPISRSSLYTLLLQVDRKLAVVETRVVSIERQMMEQVTELEGQARAFRHWMWVLLTGVVVVLIIGGVTILSIVLGAR